MRAGADYENGACRFTVWAPKARTMQVRLLGAGGRMVEMEKLERGWWRASNVTLEPGTDYFYRIDGRIDRPDPASRFQPQGVHGPSRVVDPRAFAWSDGAFAPPELRDYVMYELHIGTFTPQGTFEAAASTEKLAYLKDLGVTAIEVMPVAQFPGSRNWGYDGAYLYAPQNTYGGPEGFREYVNRAHAMGLAVVLDVVYNHFGPEGNYIRDFGPYFTDHYKTPWGDALNFDQPDSDIVREFFFENALFWFREYHVDALRLDALHSIIDQSAVHFIEKLALRVDRFSQERGRRHYLIGESDLNDVRLIRPRNHGGWGLDAQWLDDFHHSVHALLTGERQGYYADFGRPEDLARSLREGYVYSGQYSPFRRRRHGNESHGEPADKFVAFIQNHDQLGNRMNGERLASLIDFESLKLGAAALLLSPYLPLLFMGEEYGEDRPFFYFVSHGDPDLIEAVRRGRREEFSHFNWPGEFPDPQSEETFERSRLNWDKLKEPRCKTLHDFYRELIGLRRESPGFVSREGMEVFTEEDRRLVGWRRPFSKFYRLCVMNFDERAHPIRPPGAEGTWSKRLDSSEARWLGPGDGPADQWDGQGELIVPARGIVLYEQLV